MAFDIPSLRDVLERTRQAFKSNMPDSDPYIFPSNIYVSAKVIGGRIWEAFHRLEFIFKQAFVLTATGVWLERHAQAYGITRKAAVGATGSLTGSGATAATLIPAGTTLSRSDGVSYTTTAAVTVDATGIFTLAVSANTAGLDGNLDAGASLTFDVAITGAPTSVTVSTTDVIDGGRDLESDEELRIRVLQRLRFPPHAGTESDYERWALEVPGVTRVWVTGNGFGPGTVSIYFTMDGSYTNGIPTATDVATVQAYIDSLRPATATAIVIAPEAEPVNIEISGLSPFNTEVVANVKAEIEAAIGTRGFASTPKQTSYVRRSWIWQAASNATGETHHTVIQPDSDVAISVGKIPVYDENYVSIAE